MQPFIRSTHGIFSMTFALYVHMCAFVQHLRDIFITCLSHLNNHIQDYKLSLSMPNLRDVYYNFRDL